MLRISYAILPFRTDHAVDGQCDISNSWQTAEQRIGYEVANWIPQLGFDTNSAVERSTQNVVYWSFAKLLVAEN